MQVIDHQHDIDLSSYRVRVDKKEGPTHYNLSVSGLDGAWSCSCPDFIYRRSDRGEACKHIDYVQSMLVESDRFNSMKKSDEINVLRRVPFWKRFLRVYSCVRILNNFTELAAITSTRIKGVEIFLFK